MDSPFDILNRPFDITSLDGMSPDQVKNYLQSGEAMGLESPKFSWEKMMEIVKTKGPAEAYKFAHALTMKWSDNDIRFFGDWLKQAKLDVKVDDFFLVFATESNLRTDSCAPFPTGKPGACVAVGLNQMTRAAFQGMGRLSVVYDSEKNPDGTYKDPAKHDAWKKNEGVTIGLFLEMSKEIAAMNVETQLKQVIFPFFLNIEDKYSVKDWDVVSLYVANLATSHVWAAKKPDHVIFVRGDGGYAGNGSLDFNGDGKITVGDIAGVLRKNRAEKPEFIAMMYRYQTLVKPDVTTFDPSWKPPTGWPFNV